jgi:GrpB-like predicted nucleotidyltransferase (UPF0157 family)
MVELEKQDFKKNKELYKRIENKLRKDIDINIPIDHVGSTAIPNMYGKNIIDILIGVNDNNEFNKIKEILEKNGFYASTRKDIYQFFASRKEETKSGDIHIHLALINTDRYKDFLILKNYLLNNEEEALNYSNLKQDLLNNGVKEREEYKKIKSEYVSKLLERAKKYEL